MALALALGLALAIGMNSFWALVQVLVVLVAFLLGMGYRPEQITILSAYVGQLLLVKTALQAW